MDYGLNSRKTLSFAYPLIQITGGLVHLQERIACEIQEKVGNLIVIKKWSSDFERFLKSSEIIGNDITYAGLEHTLEEMNFEFVSKLEEKGQYSRVGDVVTLWPIGYANPIRIEFFDEEIEKMYFYDVVYGRKLGSVESAVLADVSILDDRIEWENISILKGQKKVDSGLKFLNGIKFSLSLQDSEFVVAIFGQVDLEADSTVDLELSYPPLFYSRIDLLKKEVQRLEEQGYEIFIQSAHKDQLDKDLKKHLFDGTDELSAGFVDKKMKRIFYTDRELFGTIFITREKQKKISSIQAKKLLNQIEGEVEIGDHIVHEDHGVGVYSGISREKDQEYLLIKYAKEDELLVPLDQIHRLTKYIGVSNKAPEVSTLDQLKWRQITEKAKKVINILARDLVNHYAKIQVSKAESVEVSETDKYQQFVAGFGFEETVDQKRTISEVFQDLSKDKPMNRLIVGDVGFGKTEVAMRAAFKTVEEGMQVAVLAPTTVLTAQHQKVFQERFKNFGINIAMMSRFSGKNKNSKIVEQLKKGEIDIVVGTHRLFSNDVAFKNLGLLIIDEEQKFGVAQKEKLKKLKLGAHVLSMTATPIPRTLSMALSQIQDISIISTPPEGRKSVKTRVQELDWNDIQKAVKREVDRGGQIYFVHNRVQTIYSIEDKLKSLLPGIKFAVGHGQMREDELEKTINDFYEKKYDCLICTTIIENGIDMPNVNTIIINKSQNFGLGQLYQLRGRVGRSKVQAYAYMFYDGEKVRQEDKKDAEKKEKEKKYIKRLEAIMESQDLGSGFKIASRDLEIRGAGNLLGREQHGQISKIGLALYMQMLAEEIERLRLISG